LHYAQILLGIWHPTTVVQGFIVSFIFSKLSTSC